MPAAKDHPERDDRPAETAVLADLPEVLEYKGEFGPELVLFLPFVNWLSAHGLLRDRRIKTYRGMTCFYEGLHCREIIEKPGKRGFVNPARRPSWLPVKDEHTFDQFRPSPHHLYPDMRAIFAAQPFAYDAALAGRPLIVVHNKYNVEWSERPINFIPLPVLDTLFAAHKADFNFVYIRHGMGEVAQGFAEDRNETEPFSDRELLSRHPEVWCFDDMYKAYRDGGGSDDVNRFKAVLYSRCHRFLSSQGGGAHQIAQYAGSRLVVNHRRGQESRWAYSKGYYNFMATPPPRLKICGTDEALISSFAFLTEKE